MRKIVPDIITISSCIEINEQLVRIDDEWYDLSRWRRAHPAGKHWIDLYKNQVEFVWNLL